MLRESSQHSGDDIDLNVLTSGDAGASGIPHDAVLVAFAEAVIGGDTEALPGARAAVHDALGAAALVDAAGIVGMFNGLDRVADATGAPLEDWKAADTAELRGAIGIDAFAATKASLEASQG